MVALTPIGSAFTCSIVGCSGAVGTSNASAPASEVMACSRRRCTSARSWTRRCAGISRAPEIICATVGSSDASGWASMNSPTAA
ncbi:Uncharacterised protein [Mycobacteroides abscessus subsp. abscessus]|nr:Uncharacterised protein [Mycobacteroides abscessus subsp. abscessus]SKT44303.1 Uncharacterised protein [Mycobacteroides abscessus subsp. abscessus]